MVSALQYDSPLFMLVKACSCVLKDILESVELTSRPHAHGAPAWRTSLECATVVQVLAPPLGIPMERKRQSLTFLLLLRLWRSSHHQPEQLCVSWVPPPPPAPLLLGIWANLPRLALTWIFLHVL